MIKDTIPGNEAGNQGCSKNLPYSKPFKASKVILPFSVEPGQRLIVLCRVSSHQQGKKGNLKGQEHHLPLEVTSRGGVVVEVVPFEWSGRGSEWLDKFSGVVDLAKKEGATILAATVDRFVRHREFDPRDANKRKLQASEVELRELLRIADGVPLMTFLHPDASPEECTSLLTKWGQAAKGNRGGKPRCLKNRRKMLLPVVKRLKSEGKSLQQIADITGVPKPTVQGWLNR